MNNGLNPQILRPSLFAALAAMAALGALPAGLAAAHAQHQAGTDSYCQLGNVMSTQSCVFDTNGDGVEDWWISDTDGDGIFDTSSLDTDYDGRAETFYTIVGSRYGEVRVRYDHDGDWLYDDEEFALYATNPYLWDSDGDGFGDNMEISEGSDPNNPYCTPYGCG